MDDTNQAATHITLALETLRKRLLDLTARNRLLNFTHTKGASLRIIDELPDQLREVLLSEEELRFLPVPEPTREQLIEAGYVEIDPETGQENRLKKDPKADEWARWLGLKTGYDLPEPIENMPGEEKHQDLAIQTLLFPYELETRLRGLRTKSVTAIEESGANILYMAFGFLEWHESTDSDKTRLAPLLLLPVRLQKGRLNPATRTYDYTLSYSGEDILPNLSLREKLKIDYGLALPDLDEETEPEVYFEEVRRLIKDNQPRWSVRRYATLSLLNFSKLLMYLDLDPERWPADNPITDHPIVDKFLSGSESDEQESNGEGYAGEEYLIDEIPDVHQLYPLVEDADSSQHSALKDALDGGNLVIEGPPGTGKSQTITNLIAAAIAQGKKVLFVAEKLAALEVVKRRLDRAGLGDFCLELHSHKTQKRHVLDEIQIRIDKGSSWREPAEIDADIARYESLKDQLSNHVKLINSQWKATRKTIHEILMAATRYREELQLNPELLHPDELDGDTFDPGRQRESQDEIKLFHDVYSAVLDQLGEGASLTDHPWCGVCNRELQLFDNDRVCAALQDWQAALEGLSDKRAEITRHFVLTDGELPARISGLQQLSVDLLQLPELEGGELLSALPVLKDNDLDAFSDYVRDFEEVQNGFTELARYCTPEILQDLSSVDTLIVGNQRLRSLAGDDVDLPALIKVVDDLRSLDKALQELAEPLSEMVAALGEPFNRYLRLHGEGLQELRQVLDLVAGMQPGLWKRRDSCFDNDELDEVLPDLEEKVQKLRSQREYMARGFNLDKMLTAGEIEQMRDTLAAGGAFSWLKKDWRTARKTLLAMGQSKSLKFKHLEAQVGSLLVFAREKEELENDRHLQELIGSIFNGIDTDVDALVSLRDWYKSIRQVYGLGFGGKVELGQALIDVPEQLGKAMRSLADRGMPNRLAEIDQSLGELRGVLTNASELQQQDSLLVGQGNVLSKIEGVLESALATCQEFFVDKDISLSEIGRCARTLKQLRDDLKAWSICDVDSRLLNGKLGLEPGHGINNEAALECAHRTEILARIVQHGIKTDVLRTSLTVQNNAVDYAAIQGIAESMKTVITQVDQACTDFSGLVKLDEAAWQAKCGDELVALRQRNQQALDQSQWLSNWLSYERSHYDMVSTGFGRLAAVVTDGTVSINDILSGYRLGVYDLLAREILRQKPELSRFSGHNQEALQKQFCSYDHKLKSLQQERIAWQASRTTVPGGIQGGRVSALTELALLRHECGKKTRHIPVRQLVRRAGGALSALKPCFMMGPMSVAQYLAPGEIEFDMVVMDEASQMKPEDALGTVARGQQLVVVGDPKQLPPTSFFDKLVDDGDEDSTMLEESESILDATLPIFNARRLRWHYRSQHESLIAFSNNSFYEGDLVLFPSPHSETDEFGVKFTRVQRGRFVNRRNMEEAKVIAEAVRDHYLHRSNETLGVVGMSAEQRDQLERAIEELAKEDPLFQDRLDNAADGDESLFVKNLENVQGDERDVIFISMTYGPQETGGRVMQRFGPINSDVGWRRLNVLFTRSRKRMHVFSSMGSNDIVVGSNSRRGVRALKDFLAYMETGIIHHSGGGSERPPDSDFEISVASALGNAGFECVPQVGVAGFFIDLAVRDPGNPGRYLMGIECDGATYHSAKSVRDRDRLRQSVLEQLGWHIRRIWSTDWYKNSLAELQPIIDELHRLKTVRDEVEEVAEESESDRIAEFVEQADREEDLIAPFVTEAVNLGEKLLHFDTNVIRKALPDTLENQRLLRPAMREALLEYLPTSKWEFLEQIPSYLRQGTEAREGQYLAQVLEIIDESR